MANSAFTSLKDSLVGAFLSDVYLRDYTHAAKTFLPNVQSNAPKVKFLFHTYFNINSAIMDSSQAWIIKLRSTS